MGEAEETNFGGWVGRSSSRLARSQDRFLEDGVVAVVEKQWYRPAQHALQRFETPSGAGRSKRVGRGRHGWLQVRQSARPLTWCCRCIR